MGSPSEYDWGLRPEQIEAIKADMSVSVSVTVDRETMKRIEATKTKEIR